MSLLLNPYELKDDIISTLNICFENVDSCSYNRKYFILLIENYLNNKQFYIKQSFTSDDITKICNYMNSIIHNKFMNKIISEYKNLSSNQNTDNSRFFNNELLLLTINKPYNEELYKSTIAFLNGCNERYCLHLFSELSNFNSNLENDIPYIWYYINDFREELKNIKNTINNNQKEIRDFKKTIDNNENQNKELKQTIYSFKKELNLIIDNCKKENQKEIEEIKKTIDNNQKENKKEIIKSKQNIYFCKKELNLIIDNNQKENQKEIENLKQLLENNNKNNQDNQKEIENLKLLLNNNNKNNKKEINKLRYVLLILFIYNSISIFIANT